MWEENGPLDPQRFELMPAEIRRQQRFGGPEAAALAEALALRREIDALAARFSRWQARYRPDTPQGDAAPVTWLHLRRAGLAMVAEIERQRSIGCTPAERPAQEWTIPEREAIPPAQS